MKRGEAETWFRGSFVCILTPELSTHGKGLRKAFGFGPVEFDAHALSGVRAEPARKLEDRNSKERTGMKRRK